MSFNPQFLTLSDDKRHVTLRVPTRGGMLEWSINDRLKDCDDQYCWGDVTQATMFVDLANIATGVIEAGKTELIFELFRRTDLACPGACSSGSMKAAMSWRM
jgi:hypothetical protein